MIIAADKQIARVEDAFGRVGDVRLFESKKISRDSLHDADVLLVRTETAVNESLLHGTPVKFVGTATIGFDHVDVPYLEKNRIHFASAPGCNANGVAEYLLSALSRLAKRMKRPLGGMTAGIIGVGNVGSKVVRILKAAGLNVLENDPPLQRKTGDKRFVPLDALMEADIISLHVPLTREGEDRTHHLFDRTRFSKLKQGTIFINTSRGPANETAALKNALKDGTVAAAVLDVWEKEPQIDKELVGLSSIATPHIAGYSLDGKLNATKMLFDALNITFNLRSQWEIDPGWLRSKTPAIDSLELEGTAEEQLRKIALHCYDIENDDAALRIIGTMNDHEGAVYFTKLRSQYLYRNEFINTTVAVSHANIRLREMLSACRFQIIEK